MGPKTWSVILKVVGLAIDEAMAYVKDKLKNGGKHDSSGTGEKE